jgi:arylsulfatase A-like enzyme
MKSTLVLLTVTTTFALAMTRFATPSQPTGLVIVTLDTTRADCLPVYGSPAVDTPALNALAANSIVFDRATTVAPLTLPAHSSLFTGLYPFHHGVRDNGDSLGAVPATLASILRANGFRTGASVGSIILLTDRGIGRGFDTYHDEIGRSRDGRPRGHRPGNEVVDDAIAWLSTVRSERFFLWVHLYDVHQPYDPPEPYASKYPGMPYLSEIAFADAQVGRLLRALDARGLARRTAVIVAGDHGESLGEHGEEAHGLFVYDSVLRVPLIIHAPGLALRRVTEPVSLVDIMPTALDLLGLHSAQLDGVSLRRAMLGRHMPERTLYAESMYPQRFGWSGLRSMRDGRFKFIDAPRPELYDTDADPGETTNLIEERATVARALVAQLTSAASRSDSSPIDESVRARLASLGYVSPAQAPGSTRPAMTADPKDHVVDYNEKMRSGLCHGNCDGRR